MEAIIQSRIDKLNQGNLLSELAKSDGNIRSLISTISYEMRYNQGVKVIIHYGPSRNIEAYRPPQEWQGEETHLTSISFPEAAILLVSDGDRDLWPDGIFESANHGLPVTLRRIKGKPQSAMLRIILTSGGYAFAFQLFNSQ